jgi:phospholipase/carboxylesterase
MKKINTVRVINIPNAYRYFTLLTLFSNESALLFMSSLTSPSDATLPDLVVFLHGSGDTGAGLRAWVGDRAPDFEATLRAAGVAVAWPDAKPRPYSMFGGALLPSWFDRTALDPHAPEDAAGVAESRAQVTAIISDHRARVEAAGGRAGKVAVVGFSQGGCLALHCAAGSAVDCVVCLSSFLPDDSGVREALGVSGGPPVFMGHGSSDAMVPAAWGAATCEWLRQHGGGRTLSWKLYPGIAHDLTAEMCSDALAFVLATFGRRR